jgi:hypothetical protein
MQKGDLVYIMGDLVADLTPITHGTPAVVLEVDRDDHRTNLKVLVQGEVIWMPDGFVKVPNAEG